jgi:hypothetical protein
VTVAGATSNAKATVTRGASKAKAAFARAPSKTRETVARGAAKVKATVARGAATVKATVKRMSDATKRTAKKVRAKMSGGDGGCSSSYDASGTFSGVSNSQFVAGNNLPSLSYPAMNNCGLSAIGGSQVLLRGNDTVVFGDGVATPGAQFSL